MKQQRHENLSWLIFSSLNLPAGFCPSCDDSSCRQIISYLHRVMDNKVLVDRFYSAFQRLDYKTMQDCYSDDAVFSDPVFGLLKGNEIRAMWEMLCRNAKDFSLSYSGIELPDHEYATCNWVATYTFSKTGRKVINHVKAFVRINEGKITEHSDAFRLSTWIGQALGWKGVLFGWTNTMKRAVQKNARKSLDRFMQGSV